MNRRAMLAGTAAAMAAAPVRGAGQASPPGSWRAEPALPWAAQEIYAAVTPGGLVVTAGGLKGRPDRGIEILDGTAVFDGARWRAGPRLPRPTHHPAIATVGARVLAFGGYAEANGGTWSNQIEVFALEVRGRRLGPAWRTVAPMPAPQAECVALAHGGNVHLVTGRTPRPGSANAGWRDQADTAAHRVFDVQEGRWREARPAPGARNSAAGAVIAGRLYVVGGRRVEGGNLGDLTRYDRRTDRWDVLRPMPQGAGGIAAAALDGRLFVFGGEWFAPGGGGVHREVWEYDPARDVWRAAAPMRTPRHGLAGVAWRGRALLIGGAERVSAQNTSAAVESFLPPPRA